MRIQRMEYERATTPLVGVIAATSGLDPKGVVASGSVQCRSLRLDGLLEE
jgi:hypothetical protein